MREVPGSIPGISKFFQIFKNYRIFYFTEKFLEWILARSTFCNKVNNFDITIGVHETFGELVNLFVGHLISQSCQRSVKCGNVDFALAIVIENLEITKLIGQKKSVNLEPKISAWNGRSFIVQVRPNRG